MSGHAVIYDCEWLTTVGAQSRFWCGPYDPDPFLVQIGAVKIGLYDDLPILEKKVFFIIPVDRTGLRTALDNFFTDLTGISESDIDRHGLPLAQVLDEFSAFGHGCSYWAWGKDEIYTLAQSCFIAGISMPIPAWRFNNASKLFLHAGMSIDDMLKTNSGRLASYFGLDVADEIKEHNALDDALSIVYALRHVVQLGKLDIECFEMLAT